MNLRVNAINNCSTPLAGPIGNAGMTLTRLFAIRFFSVFGGVKQRDIYSIWCWMVGYVSSKESCTLDATYVATTLHRSIALFVV
jgi:hypothetical protein